VSASNPPAHFTVRYAGRANVLLTEVKVASPIQSPEQLAGANFQTYRAIWDTGASHSVITQPVIAGLGLSPTGMSQVRNAHGETTTEVFFVAIGLPNHVCVPGVRVTKGDLGAGAEMLIGMDIIGLGDFAVTNHQNQTVMTFRMPSSECIDFASAPKPVAVAPSVVRSVKVGRNDPCPCGSGKKHKKCCAT